LELFEKQITVSIKNGVVGNTGSTIPIIPNANEIHATTK